MVNLLLVFLGGGAGAAARYLFGIGYVRALGPGMAFPGTFLINVLGGLFMGLLIGGLALRASPDQERLRLLLAVGVLGGFTTFSSFSLETVLMIQRKAYALAASYVALSVGLSVLAVLGGLLLMRRLAPGAGAA